MNRKILPVACILAATLLSACGQEKEDYEAEYRNAGIEAASSGDYATARDNFILSLQNHSGTINNLVYDTNYYLGMCDEELGDYESALTVYSAIISMNKKAYDAYLERGLCYLEIGDKNSADADFAVLTDKGRYIDVCTVMSKAGYTEEGATYLNTILNDNDIKKSDYDRGRIYYYLGDYSAARTYLEKSDTGKSADAVLMLGKTYEALGDYTYAASLYNEYINSSQSNAAIYNRLGICKMKEGNYEEALSAFSFGIKLNDSDSMQSLLYNEAVAYEYLNDYATALEKMQAYAGAYPYDSAAQHELKYLETR